MHYVFDTEFMLRLAYAGEMPALISDELAVRVVHNDAKSADETAFKREARRLPKLARPQLSRRERVALTLGAGAIRLGFYR